MASGELLLEVNNLHVEYPTSNGPARAVNGVEFGIRKGEIVGLVGESGSGKSSVALALLNVVRHPGSITAGTILLAGEDLRKIGEKRLRQVRGKDISLVVQNPKASLNPMLRIGPQMVNVIRAHEDIDSAGARTQAAEMLRVVGINDPERRLEAYPHELSGGMAQRVLIAMALVCRPKILIADEPTSGLDVTIQAQILDDLARGVETTGSSALIVTQDLGIIANYCDRVLVMYAGQIVEAASVNELFDRPLHPCTLGLFSVHRSRQGERLLPGRVSLVKLPQGCYLEPRCPRSDGDGCARNRQVLEEVIPGHFVRCQRWELSTGVGSSGSLEKAPVS